MNRKTASALIVLLLVSASLFTAYTSSIEVVTAEAGTAVGGIISEDRTWTPEGSPYIFLDNVTVAHGVTLTITPGTVVDLKLASFLIEGTLHAEGTENQTITFQAQKRLSYSWPPRIYFNTTSTPWEEATGTGCIIDHATIYVPNYQYETVMGDYPKISNNIFYNYGNDAAAIRTNGLVINNTVLGGYVGILGQFNATILQNTVKDAIVGISCGYISIEPVYHPIIIGNLLENNTKGIEIWSNSPYIANNTITSNSNGIYFTSYTFEREAAPVAIINNNIYGNDYDVYVGGNDSQRILDMTYNWWGTTAESLIAQSIYDNADNPALAKVVYVPFLTELNAYAVPDSNVSTCNPTPIATVNATSRPNQFKIESNSTVSAMSFNATSSEISFTVNGTSGTTGYVKATISKSIMPNSEGIKVYLDGNPINCTITSDGDSWVIIFTYSHSSHQVRINQVTENNAVSLLESEYIGYIAVGVIAALLALLGLLVWLAKSKGSNQT